MTEKAREAAATREREGRLVKNALKGSRTTGAEIRRHALDAEWDGACRVVLHSCVSGWPTWSRQSVTAEPNRGRAARLSKSAQVLVT